MEASQIILLAGASTGIYFLYKIVMALKRTLFRVGVIAAALTQTGVTTDFKNVNTDNLIPSLIENNVVTKKVNNIVTNILQS